MTVVVDYKVKMSDIDYLAFFLCFPLQKEIKII